MNNYVIYTLSDPFTNQVKYVGITCRSLKIRLQDHWADIHHKTYKSNWIKYLKELKTKPIIEEIDTVKSISEAHLMEMYWISQFKSWGFTLTNSTLGGEGGLGYKHTEESIKKMREIQAARPKKPKKIRMTKDEKYSNLSNVLKIPILQYDLDGNFIKKWLSRIDAAKYYNIGSSAIGHALSDYTRCAGNFLWRKDSLFIEMKISPYKKVGNKNSLIVEDTYTNEVNTYSSNAQAFKIIGRPTDPSLFINKDRLYKKRYKLSTK